MAVARISEEQLGAWARPAFEHEERLAESAERTIGQAIEAGPNLAAMGISVYAFGSFRKGTAVASDAIVDVAVEYTDLIYPEYASGSDAAEIQKAFGLHAYEGPFRDPSGPRPDLYKKAVGAALDGAFEKPAVLRHDFGFTVTPQPDAPKIRAVPCITYVKYLSAQNYRRGIRLLPERAPSHWVFNYPQQNLANALAKNGETAGDFARMVRIMRALQQHMLAEGTSPPLSGYLIESLLFNCPNELFAGEKWAPRVRSLLARIWEGTAEPASEQSWVELNRFKYLFHAWQRWSRDDARRFAHAAWQYVVEP
jgi:hypothetical protein